MTWLWIALKGAKQVPWWAWVAAAVASAVALHLHNDDARVSRAYAAGRAAMAAEARASVAAYTRAVNAQIAKRDSAIAQTKKADMALTTKAKTYTQKRAALPPQPPVVEEVLKAADSVVLAAATFQQAVITERIVTDTLVVIDTLQVHALTVTHLADSARITVLEKRPTKKRAAFYALVSAAIAALTTYGATR